MECIKAKELILKKIDEELLKSQISPLKKHLKKCAECREFYDQEKSLVQEIKNIPLKKPPGKIKEEVIYYYKQTATSFNFKKWMSIYHVGLKSAFASAAAAGLIFGFIFAEKTFEKESISQNQENIYIMAVKNDTGGLF